MAEAQSEGADNTVSFAQKLSESPRFKSLFRDGMDLVEEVAGYLDGEGRETARDMPRTVALAYAAESMRLTTRLMQIASWLLVQRAVIEGEMSQTQAETEKNKVRLCAQDIASGPDLFARLPAPLRDLVERSLRLQARVLYLDQSIRTPEAAPAPTPVASGVAAQWQMLHSAFDQAPRA